MTEIKIELSYEERLELIPALVDVARAYYEEPDKINTLAGICYNVMEIGKVESAYCRIGSLMKELGYNDDYFEGFEPSDTKDNYEAWEKRAMMCLVLSEYLWSTLDATMPVGDTVQAKPTKSIFQKVKDKVNEVQENLRLYFETRDSLSRKIKGS